MAIKWNNKIFFIIWLFPSAWYHRFRILFGVGIAVHTFYLPLIRDNVNVCKLIHAQSSHVRKTYELIEHTTWRRKIVVWARWLTQLGELCMCDWCVIVVSASCCVRMPGHFSFSLPPCSLSLSITRTHTHCLSLFFFFFFFLFRSEHSIPKCLYHRC